MSELPREPLSSGSEVVPPPTVGSAFPNPYESSEPQPGSSSPPDSSSKVETAKGEAQQVTDTAVGSGKEVASTAKEEGKNVAAETKQQALSLLETVRAEVGEQASTSQGRIADALHSLSKELGSMASNSQESGPLTDLAHQASHKGGEIAHWLQEREPSDVVEEVRSYARRRPGTFLVLCGLAGVVAGRLTRGAVASRTSLDSKDDGQHGDRLGSGRTGRPDGYPGAYTTAPVTAPAVETSAGVQTGIAPGPSTGAYGGTVSSARPATGTDRGSDPYLPGSGYVGTSGALDDPNGDPTR